MIGDTTNSQGKKATCILSIEIFDDDIIVIRYGDQKLVRKIKNPLAILPMLFSIFPVIIGSEKVKEIETWLDHVWIKKTKQP